MTEEQQGEANSFDLRPRTIDDLELALYAVISPAIREAIRRFAADPRLAVAADYYRVQQAKHEHRQRARRPPWRPLRKTCNRRMVHGCRMGRPPRSDR